MSEKRRDSKNRILQNGESQRKDGKYEFKYVDVNGTRRSASSLIVYSRQYPIWYIFDEGGQIDSWMHILRIL